MDGVKEPGISRLVGLVDVAVMMSGGILCGLNLGRS